MAAFPQGTIPPLTPLGTHLGASEARGARGALLLVSCGRIKNGYYILKGGRRMPETNTSLFLPSTREFFEKVGCTVVGRRRRLDDDASMASWDVLPTAVGPKLTMANAGLHVCSACCFI